MTIRKARQHIIDCLRNQGLLVRRETIQHMVAIHERCGTDVEFLPSRQWYIDVLTDREKYLKAADEIHWHPSPYEEALSDVGGKFKVGLVYFETAVFWRSVSSVVLQGLQTACFAAPEQLPVNPLETNPLHACACGCTDFIPETAVFDTWATSSVTTLINARYGEPQDCTDELLPMGMRSQAHEIIRTWAFYSIVKSLYHTGRILVA